MLDRRTLLVSGGAVLLGLTGCTETSVVWLPWTSPSPLPVSDPTQIAGTWAQVGSLAATIATATTGLDEPQRRGLTWFAEAAALQAGVLSSADPARRQTGRVPPVPPPTLPGAPKKALAMLDAALAALVAQLRTRAVTADGVPALLWAGQAALADTARGVLPVGAFTGAADGATTTPKPATQDWRVVMIARSREAAYGFETCLAARSLPASEQTRLRAQLSSWRRLRDTLIDAQRSSGAALPSAPVGYSLPVPSGSEGARALARSLSERSLPQLGAWVAGTTVLEDRALAVDQLRRTSRASVAFGAPLLRWPGWAG